MLRKEGFQKLRHEDSRQGEEEQEKGMLSNMWGHKSLSMNVRWKSFLHNRNEEKISWANWNLCKEAVGVQPSLAGAQWSSEGAWWSLEGVWDWPAISTQSSGSKTSADHTLGVSENHTEGQFVGTWVPSHNSENHKNQILRVHKAACYSLDNTLLRDHHRYVNSRRQCKAVTVTGKAEQEKIGR